MEKIAFFISPANWEIFSQNLNQLKPSKIYREELIKPMLQWANPKVFKSFSELTFDSKKYFEGCIILVPFFPDRHYKDSKFVLDKIESAFEVAKKENCTIATLTGFNSIAVQSRESYFEKKYNIKVTSGNTTTATIIVKSILDISDKFNLDLSVSSLAIIGATGDIGRGCFLGLAEYFQKIWLTGRGLKPLEELYNTYASIYDCDMEITMDSEFAISESQIAIFVTSSPKELFHLNDLPKKTIICDASSPINIKTGDSLRDDVFLYHGGIVNIPFEFNLGFDSGLSSQSHVYGCELEGMLMGVNPDLSGSHGRGNIDSFRLNTFESELIKYPNISLAYSWKNKQYHNMELLTYANYWRNS